MSKDLDGEFNLLIQTSEAKFNMKIIVKTIVLNEVENNKILKEALEYMKEELLGVDID